MPDPRNLFFIFLLIPCLSFADSANLNRSVPSNDTCTITQPASGPNSSRMRQVQFADGREILIIGHNHGERELPFLLRDLLLKDATQVSNEEFLAQLESLAQTVRPAIGQAVVDLQYLRSLLKTSPHLKFVGFESTDKTLKANLEGYTLLQETFRKVISSRGITLSEPVSELPLVALGPICFLRLNEPDLFTDREVRGFESERGMMAYAQAATAVTDAHYKVVGIAKQDKAFMRDFNGTNLQLWDLYDNYTPETDEAQIKAQIRSADIPSAYRQVTIDWVDARLTEMNALKLRERDVVDSMLQTGRSGVLLMGQKHLNSITKILASKCKDLSSQ